MKSKLSSTVLLILLVLCFLMGLMSALARRSPAEPTGSPPSASRLPTSASGQMTVLILGLDSLQAPDPSLLAVWYASFQLPARDIFLLGIPTDLAVGEDAQIPLSSLFSWSEFDGVDPLFLVSLNQATLMIQDVVISLDRSGFAALVDYLGGLELSGVHIDGSQVMAMLDLLAEDPKASLATQARVLEAMSLRAPILGITPDVTPLLGLVPEHARISVPLTEAAAMIAPLLPMEPGAIHFAQFPEPQATPALPAE